MFKIIYTYTMGETSPSRQSRGAQDPLPVERIPGGDRAGKHHSGDLATKVENFHEMMLSLTP